MSTAAPVAVEVDELSPSEVLRAARDEKAFEDAAAARTLLLAATWADLHPVYDDLDAASFSSAGMDGVEPISGPGCPLVAEFCVPEFGAVTGRSTDAAKRLIGHALELRHRLPRLWSLVQAGQVPAWRACRVAEATIHATPALTKEAARWIDTQVAAVTGKVGPAQTDRLVEAAIERFRLAAIDPTQDPEDGWLHVDRRHATIHSEQVGMDGTVHVTADLDLADALDLDHALAANAAALKTLGCEGSLDVRRSMALGELARHQTALDLAGDTVAEACEGFHPDPDRPSATELASTRAASAREVVLHLHLSAHAVGDGTLVLDELGRLEKGQRLVLLEQIRTWCGQSGTKVTIKPVLDLRREKTAVGYAIPDRIRDHVIARDGTCTFPHCTRLARRCDVDHVVPFDHDAEAEGRPQPGPTTTSNLAALCRRHHRLKTKTAWRVLMPEPGELIWTSPHGHVLRRGPEGTTYLHGPGDPAGQSDDPPRP